MRASRFIQLALLALLAGASAAAADNILFQDDFTSDPTTSPSWNWVRMNPGVPADEAAWSGGQLMLTNAASLRGTVGRILGVTMPTNCWSMSFDYKFDLGVGTSDGGSAGADGITFLFWKDFTYLTPPYANGGERMISRPGGGAVGSAGYGVEIDSWRNLPWDPTTSQAALLRNDARTNMAVGTMATTADGIWRTMRIQYSPGQLTAQLNGVTLFTYTGTFSTTYPSFGFAATTGSAAYARQWLDNVVLQDCLPPVAVVDDPILVADLECGIYRYILPVHASDDGPGPLTYRLTVDAGPGVDIIETWSGYGAHNFTNFTAGSFRLNGYVTTLTLRVTAPDASVTTVVRTFDARNDSNCCPTLVPPPWAVIRPGLSASQVFTAIDPEGQGMTFGFGPMRPGITWEAGPRRATWTTPDVREGMYIFTVSVTDVAAFHTPLLSPCTSTGEWIVIVSLATDDTDADGVQDDSDNCPAMSNEAQTDGDLNGVGDDCEPQPQDGDTQISTPPGEPNPESDADLDGISDWRDNCPAHSNTDQRDLDEDTQGDACDGDMDGDGVAETAGIVAADNCPRRPNQDQADSGGDGRGDACDAAGAARARAFRETQASNTTAPLSNSVESATPTSSLLGVGLAGSVVLLTGLLAVMLGLRRR